MFSHGWFIVYGRENCQWCDLAKKTLTDLDAEYEYSDIEKEPKELVQFKEDFPGAKTVPQIYWSDGKNNQEAFIGGYTELVEWLKHYTKN